MDNVVLQDYAFEFVGLARRWAAVNQQPQHTRLYMVAEIDGNIPIDLECWPFFYHNPQTVRKFFEATYPHTRHLVELDLSSGNPRACWKER